MIGSPVLVQLDLHVLLPEGRPHLLPVNSAEQRDELAPFQLIELHSFPASELQDIELAMVSQERYRPNTDPSARYRLNCTSRCTLSELKLIGLRKSQALWCHVIYRAIGRALVGAPPIDGSKFVEMVVMGRGRERVAPEHVVDH
jgi:hypothetical protein